MSNVDFTNQEPTIEAYYTESTRAQQQNDTKWLPLVDNDNYEVSDNARIRKVGGHYALPSHATGEVLTSERKYKGKMVVTRYNVRKVRVFKDGKPYKVDPTEERAKAFNCKIRRAYI